MRQNGEERPWLFDTEMQVEDVHVVTTVQSTRTRFPVSIWTDFTAHAYAGSTDGGAAAVAVPRELGVTDIGMYGARSARLQHGFAALGIFS